MRLARLIADFQLSQTRLARSVMQGTGIATQVALMRHTAALMDTIEAHDPASPAELRSKVEFFFERAQRTGGKRELNIALSLINRFEGRWSLRGPSQNRSARPYEVLERLAYRGAAHSEMARLVSDMPQRASLIDRSFRHICTSQGNAAFHNRPSAEFDGLHMGDLIGATRYHSRAKPEMTRTLDGRPVAYYYPLDVPVLGTRVMQCFMRRWRKCTDEIGGLVIWINDVTDKLTSAHNFADISAAWPDHSIDGTT
ncbi:hypothetical protein [Oceaniglobus ichthyenteri]|uniref:hypothetical protein n=1 Tax=Oceaniglobus ichthyenteri TaxID=2136177 RepID=UPI000F8421FD|nr:hypothetical protein [Oceaniglobus ichthyenteri]